MTEIGDGFITSGINTQHYAPDRAAKVLIREHGHLLHRQSLRHEPAQADHVRLHLHGGHGDGLASLYDIGGGQPHNPEGAGQDLLHTLIHEHVE